MLFFFSLLIPYAAILGFSTLWKQWGNWPLSHSIFATVSALAIWQFLCAVFDYIQIGSVVILSLGCLVLLYYLLKPGRNKYFEVETILYFFLGFIAVALFAWGLKFRSIDDYSFWGVMSKHVYLIKHLPVDDSIISSNFLMYVPGMATFHYLFYGVSDQYSQFAGYVAQGTILLAALMVLFQPNAIKRSLIKTALVYSIISIGFGTVLARMEVDAYVATYLFAITWLIVTRAQKTPVLLFFPVLFLSLIKEIGFFFAFLMIVLLWISQKENRKIILLLLISLLCLKWVWLWHCQHANFKSFAHAITWSVALQALTPWNEYFQTAQRLFLESFLFGKFGHVLAVPNVVIYAVLFYAWKFILSSNRVIHTAPTSRGLTAGSSNLASDMNPAVKLREIVVKKKLEQLPLKSVAYLYCIGLFFYLIMLYLLQAIVFQVGHAVDHILDFQRYYNMLLIPFTLISALLYYEKIVLEKFSLITQQRIAWAIVFIASVFAISGKIERTLRYYMPSTISPLVTYLDSRLPKDKSWSLCYAPSVKFDYHLILPLKYFFLPNTIQVAGSDSKCDYWLTTSGDEYLLKSQANQRLPTK